MAHPRERYTRRDFLRRSALGAAAVPSLAAILDACSNPRNNSGIPGGGGAIGTGGSPAPGTPYPLARQDAPVTWTIFPDREPIKSDLQPEPNATLQIYNWNQYIWKKTVQDFCNYIQKTYNTTCKFQITTFNNMEEAYAKMQTGQLVSRSTGFSSSVWSHPSSSELVARRFLVRRKLSTSRLRVMVVIHTCSEPLPISKLDRFE